VWVLFFMFRFPSARWGPWQRKPEANPWMPACAGKAVRELEKAQNRQKENKVGKARPAGAAAQREAKQIQPALAKQQP